MQLLLEDWAHTQRKLADTETRMHAVLDELELTTRGHVHPWTVHRSGRRRSWPRPATHTGSPTPGRWSSTPAWHRGRSSRAASPAAPSSPAKADSKLRLAAWRAVWGALQTDTVYAARYPHLTTRESNRLTATQAQTVLAAAMLRPARSHHHRHRLGDPLIATHGPLPSRPGRQPQSEQEHHQGQHRRAERRTFPHGLQTNLVSGVPETNWAGRSRAMATANPITESTRRPAPSCGRG